MKKNLNKILAVALAVTMLALIGVSATLAWLYDKEVSIENTWTVGKVYIDLTETGIDGNRKGSLHIVPGTTEGKDPKVTVEKGSEKAYVFIKVEETLGALDNKGNGLKDYAEYTIVNTWTPLDDVDNVYYQIVDENAENDTVLPILVGDKVTYSSELTNADLAKVQTGPTGNAGDKPTLTFTAYAIQFNYIPGADDAAKLAQAWSIVSTAP